MFGFLVSCEEDSSEETPKVVARIAYSPKEEIGVGTEITFTNYSENAMFYEWDFGDGNISTKTHPQHAYEQIGEYDVKLIAKNEISVDTASTKITIEFTIPESYFLYNNEYYQLDTGIIKISSPNEYGKYCLSIILFSSGVTYSIEDSLTGNGDAVFLTINSDTNYFHGLMDWQSSFAINYNFETSEGILLKDLRERSFSFREPNDVYHFTFQSGDITCVYNGYLAQYDY